MSKHVEPLKAAEPEIPVPSMLQEDRSDDLIGVPAFLSAPHDISTYATCSAIQCGICESMCQNCLGTGCVGGQGGCGSCENNSCESVCQNCLGASLGCTGCEARPCQSCESPCEKSSQSCQSTCENTPQTPKKRATISISGITANSATVRITRNDASSIHAVVREADGAQAIIWDTGNIGISQPTATHTLTDLSPSTAYAYNLWDDIGGWIGTEEFTTLSKPRPKYWSWTNGLVSSKPATNALSSRDDIPAYLTAAGWTAFVQNIKDVYSYSTGANYLGTLSNGGNGTTKLSADMVNEAITAIGAMTSSYLPSKTTANITKLSASLLNGLADSLNSIS